MFPVNFHCLTVNKSPLLVDHPPVAMIATQRCKARLGKGVPKIDGEGNAVSRLGNSRGDVVLARDETYFDGPAFLIGVEPRTYVLLIGQVEESCDSETWGLSLALDQAREGLRIVGVAEDGARFYARSQEEAAMLLGNDFSVPVQKDVWHGLDKAAQKVTDLERIALCQLKQAQKKGDELAALPWDEAAFEAWAEMDEEAERLVEKSGEVRFWYGCLCDALEIADLALRRDPRQRSFQSRETDQNWFNLFRLWFCMHPFKRSQKRHGQSPF
jgi:hypothetical protein